MFLRLEITVELTLMHSFLFTFKIIIDLRFNYFFILFFFLNFLSISNPTREANLQCDNSSADVPIQNQICQFNLQIFKDKLTHYNTIVDCHRESSARSILAGISLMYCLYLNLWDSAHHSRLYWHFCMVFHLYISQRIVLLYCVVRQKYGKL